MPSIKFELQSNLSGIYDSLRFSYMDIPIQDVKVDDFIQVSNHLYDFIYTNRPFSLNEGNLMFIPDTNRLSEEYLSGETRVWIGKGSIYLSKLDIIKLLTSVYLTCLRIYRKYFPNSFTPEEYLYRGYGLCLLDANLGCALMDLETPPYPLMGYDNESLVQLISNLHIEKINANTVLILLQHVKAGDILKRARWFTLYGEARDYCFYTLEAQCLGIGELPNVSKIEEAEQYETRYIATTYGLTKENAFILYQWAVLKNISPKDMIYLINQTI